MTPARDSASQGLRATLATELESLREELGRPLESLFLEDVRDADLVHPHHLSAGNDSRVVSIRAHSITHRELDGEWK